LTIENFTWKLSKHDKESNEEFIKMSAFWRPFNMTQNLNVFYKQIIKPNANIDISVDIIIL